MGLLVATAVAAAALAVPAAANAKNECTLANGVLDVTMDGGAGFQTAGGTIAVSYHGGPLTCKGGTPTVNNTEVIRVVDVSDNKNTSAPLDGDSGLSIRDPDSFAPGRTPEDAPGRSEIEWVVNMNNGRDSLSVVTGAERPANWLLGSTGANWNGDPDPDMNLGSFDQIQFFGSLYADRISLRGGGAMGAPVSLQSTSINTRDGDDTLLGGDGDDSLEGGTGNDTLVGHGGNDELQDRGGDDFFAAGPGTDSINLFYAKPAARVDLGASGGQDTGAGRDSIDGVEDVYGTPGPDVLIGNESANHLAGGDGDDTFDGKGGSDAFDAYEGNDTVVYESAGSPVNVDLVTGKAQDRDGVDTLYQVENVVGSPYADTLTGNGMANRIVGGAGIDTIAAADGADRVEVRDGEADRVSCGDDAATDSVIGDRRGVDALSADCESLDLLPEPMEPGAVGPGPVEQGPVEPGPGGPGAGGPGSGGGTDPALTFALSGSRVQRVLKQKAVRVQVTCPARPCNATVGATVSVPRSRRGSRPVARLRLRPVTVAVGAGTARTVTLRLTRSQLAVVRRALAAKRIPAVSVVGTASDAGGNRVERTLRVKGRR